MFSTAQDLFSSTAKSRLETQVSAWNEFGIKAFEGIAKFSDLNMRLMKASLEDTSSSMRALISSDSTLDFFSRAATHAQPNIRKFISYGSAAAHILSDIQGAFLKATQIDMADANQEMSTFFDDVTQYETDRFKNMVKMTNDTVENVKEDYEQAAKSISPEFDDLYEPESEHIRKSSKGSSAQHHTASSQSKKNSSSASKKGDGHRKA